MIHASRRCLMALYPYFSILKQLVPLLKECWLEQEVPSTNQILVKLGQVLPTAAV